MDIKLSIIIVNFNTSELLKECLLSIRTDVPHKIIVVDNASKDNSVAMLKKDFPEVLVIENSKDLGFAAANNLGVKKAKGEYLLFLNPDTLIKDENIFEVLLSEFEKDKKTAAVTCKITLPNGKLDDACHRGFPTPLNALFHFTGLSKIFPKIKFFSGYNLTYLDLNQTHEINACAGAFMLVKKEFGDKIGWWDEDYHWYGEDLDFCFRLKELGYKILYVPKVSIFHYKGASSGLKKYKTDRQTKRKAINSRFDVMKIFYQKHYDHKYSPFLKFLVFLAVELKRKLALLTT